MCSCSKSSAACSDTADGQSFTSKWMRLTAWEVIASQMQRRTILRVQTGSASALRTRRVAEGGSPQALDPLRLADLGSDEHARPSEVVASFSPARVGQGPQPAQGADERKKASRIPKEILCSSVFCHTAMDVGEHLDAPGVDVRSHQPSGKRGECDDGGLTSSFLCHLPSPIC